MAKYDEGDGVWRTIGGRKVFIREGQSISSAMKESGKFKPATKGNSDKAKREAEFEKNIDEMYKKYHGKTDKEIAEEMAKERGERILTDEEQKEREVQFMKNLEKEVESGKIKVDPNDRATLNKIADSYDNIDKYEGLDDISKDYIKNRRQEMSRQEFTNKANEIHEKSLQKAIENEKTTDSDKRYNTNSDESFKMYNSQYDKEVTVKKGPDGKWIDSDGNKYMGYLSKDDVKKYFKGNWQESKETRSASQIISDQMSKTANAMDETAKALGIKRDKENGWKTTAQLYREQKGKDLVETAINSKDVKKYNDFVEKNHSWDDRNFSDRKAIDKYAKENNLDADSLYYMTKIASESDRQKLKKASENTKTTNNINEELRKQVKSRIWAEKTLNEQYNNSDRQGKKELTDYFNQQLRKQKELENKYGKVSEEDFNKIRSDIYKESEEYKKSQEKNLSDTLRRKAYEKYLKEHPASKMKFEDFIK